MDLPPPSQAQVSRKRFDRPQHVTWEADHPIDCTTLHRRVFTRSGPVLGSAGLTGLAAIYRMCYIPYVRWSVETLDVVDDEIMELPPKLQARLLRLFEMIESLGLDQLHEPHVKHLDGKLWELRAKAAEGIARGIYVAVTGRRVVVLHVFVKKSQKTPRLALELAQERMKELKP